MEVFKKAVEANVPIITVRTTDVINVTDVIKHITDRAPVRLTDGIIQKLGDPKKLPTLDKGLLYFRINGVVDDDFVRSVYDPMTTLKSTVIIINPDKVISSAFDCGELPTPRAMLQHWMEAMVTDKAKAEALTMALGGCTLREAAEICLMTMADQHALTPAGIGSTRRQLFLGSQGLYPVDTTNTFYVPSTKLMAYALREKPFFFNPPEPRFQPRGLLFKGPSGTGKSSAAKWLAETWGVALYRLSVGDAKNRYVGDSEGNIRAAMDQLDAQEPCIVLVDEIEKIFDATHESSTTSSMLSSLLWWWAEHRSRVFVVMTCNDISKVPPEVYRPGRVDQVMELPGLGKEEAFGFVKSLEKEFKAKLSPADQSKIIGNAFADSPLGTTPPTVAHAALQHQTIQWIKTNSKA